MCGMFLHFVQFLNTLFVHTCVYLSYQLLDMLCIRCIFSSVFSFSVYNGLQFFFNCFVWFSCCVHVYICFVLFMVVHVVMVFLKLYLFSILYDALCVFPCISFYVFALYVHILWRTPCSPCLTRAAWR